jgi:hypothetical protein
LPQTGGGGDPHSTGRWKKPFGVAALVALLGGGGYVGYTQWRSGNASATELAVQGADSQPIVSQQAEGAGDSIPNENVQESVKEESIETLADAIGGTSEATGQHEAKADLSTMSEQPAQGSDIPTGTLEQKARQVIRGDFGNGQVRKDRLGAEYAEIQGKVNEMYRNGTWRN